MESGVLCHHWVLLVHAYSLLRVFRYRNMTVDGLYADLICCGQSLNNTQHGPLDLT